MTSLTVDQDPVLFLAYKFNIGSTSFIRSYDYLMQGPEHAFAYRLDSSSPVSYQFEPG
jgi:hypothetical protein